jgi:hypothetical protein
MSPGAPGGQSDAPDALDERWRELGQVLAARSPEVFRQAVEFFEALVVEVEDQREGSPIKPT